MSKLITLPQAARFSRATMRILRGLPSYTQRDIGAPVSTLDDSAATLFNANWSAAR